MSTINRKTVLDAIRAIGLVPDDVASLHIDTHRVEAIVFAHDEQGRRYLIPRSAGCYDDDLEYAKSVVQLAIVDDDASDRP